MNTIEIYALLAFIEKSTIPRTFEVYLEDFGQPSRLKLNQLNKQSIKKLSEKINNNTSVKASSKKSEGKTNLLEWKKGEYKLMVWTMAFYCFVHDLEPQKLVLFPII